MLVAFHAGPKVFCWFHFSSKYEVGRLRDPNNFTGEKGRGWQKLADAVLAAYGHRYQRSVDYLSKLAQNRFWEEAELEAFPWLERVQHGPAVAVPRYVMNEAILNALAPAVPLRAVWGGDRRR